MIKILKQTDYALQLLLELSKLENDNLLALRQFSNKSSISFLFLQKIAKSMREAGLIKSVKGKRGGYKLNKGIDKISLNEVIEAIEGPYGSAECFQYNSACIRSPKCAVRKGMSKINSDLIKYLKNKTVENLFVNNLN